MFKHSCRLLSSGVALQSRARSKFALDEHFIQHFTSRKPVFGFNGLGELVYRRSYARIHPETNKQEEWWQTIQRVINGTFGLLQNHTLEHDLSWDPDEMQKQAQQMYVKMFEMKFLPGGRGLWAMGSRITEEKKLYAAVNNCTFVSTGTMDRDPSQPFTFVLDCCMLGIGCGFDCAGAGFYVPGVNTALPKRLHVIEDSREGWVEALKLTMDSHFLHMAPVTFDYSRIRPKGSKIKTFGGISSGSKPLEEFLIALDSKLTSLAKTHLQDSTIVDIMNLIALCISSGNVRRTAQIALGDPYSKSYLNLKNYKVNPQRLAYGWASNNSVYADLGMNYNDICDRIRDNGEPGLCWLENMKRYGRMKDPVNNKDIRAGGGAPCLEQTLESNELCNLAELFPYHHKDYDLQEFKDTAKYAYLYAKIVTLGDTPWKESNRVLHNNRRIGISMSGIQQFVSKYGMNTLQTYCDETYDMLNKLDHDVSAQWKINESIKKTCVKPSGSVSLLAGNTPGMHWPESRYYIRRVRISKEAHALVKPLLEANYHLEEAHEDKSTLCVSFPVALVDSDTDTGDDENSNGRNGIIKSIDQVSMREQLEMTSFLQRHWTDNQVSVTVSFNKEKEGDQLPKMLDEFQYQLKSVSFLPRFNSKEQNTYTQMPYEAISKQQYHEMLNQLKPLNFRKFTQEMDADRDMQPEQYCDKDSCRAF